MRAPPFARLWESHPAVCGEPYPCRSPDGKPHFENQCAVRMALALERAGVSLRSFRGARCWHGHGAGHVLRAQELADWLRARPRTFGPVTRLRPARPEDVPGRAIVFFRNFHGTNNQGDHIDVWDGRAMCAGDPSYFGRSEEVWFWGLS